ncbi:Hypothetical protein GLP15_5220 [Giardia lamblia P15]|uniref:Uncharacterized protein n=1 Tax=Giardia intestinalis (strain P15) TaxID=658858 RepID=E1EWE9_GIAIA|nr:Hypothetical protein GLP15_5220 [Giardia lamblia P15]
MPPLVPKPPSPKLLKQAKMLPIDRLEYTFTPHVLEAARAATPNDPETQAINVVYRLYNSHKRYTDKMERQRNAIKQQREMDEVAECSFNPQTKVSQVSGGKMRVYSKPFLERQEKWTEKVKRKRKLIEELNQIREDAELLFCPEVNERSRYLAERNPQRHTFSDAHLSTELQESRKAPLTPSRYDGIPYGYTVREKGLRGSSVSISKPAANYMTLADLADIVEQDQCFGYPEITAKAATLDRKGHVFDRLYDMSKRQRSTSIDIAPISHDGARKGTRSLSASAQTYQRLYENHKDIAARKHKREEQYYQRITSGGTSAERYGEQWVRKRDVLARRAMQRKGLDIGSPSLSHTRHSESALDDTVSSTSTSTFATPATEHLTRHFVTIRDSSAEGYNKPESRRQSTSVLDLDLLAKEAERLASPRLRSNEHTSMSADLTDSQFQLIGYGEELDMELEAMNDAISRRTQQRSVLKQNPGPQTCSQKRFQASTRQSQMSVFDRLAALKVIKDNEEVQKGQDETAGHIPKGASTSNADTAAFLARMQHYADKAKAKQEQLRQEIESKRSEEASFKPDLTQSKLGSSRYKDRLVGDMHTREEQWLARKKARQEQVKIDMLEERIRKEEREEQQLRNCLENSKTHNLKQLHRALVGKNEEVLIHGSGRAFPRNADELTAMANQVEKACLILNTPSPPEQSHTGQSLRRGSTFGLTDLLPTSVASAKSRMEPRGSPSYAASGTIDPSHKTLTLLSSIGNGSVVNACNTIDSITNHIARMKKGAQLRTERTTGYLCPDEWLLS